MKVCIRKEETLVVVGSLVLLSVLGGVKVDSNGSKVGTEWRTDRETGGVYRQAHKTINRTDTKDVKSRELAGKGNGRGMKKYH